jgi:predicted Zn-dependent protease
MLAGARDADDVDYLFTVAEVGDATEAASLLAGLLARYSHGTIEAGDFGPEVRAALALRGGDAGAAVAALQPALRYQSRTFDIAYVLGRSALAQGDGARARGAFQTILDHQGWYPESPLYALAQLGLARSDLLVDDAGGARRAYAAFLAGWADADTDQPLLAAAKRELAGL